MENNLLSSWQRFLEGSKKMGYNAYKCEVCLSVDTVGKNVTCKITGSVIKDINERNFDCPLNKEGSKQHA